MSWSMWKGIFERIYAGVTGDMPRQSDCFDGRCRIFLLSIVKRRATADAGKERSQETIVS